MGNLIRVGAKADIGPGSSVKIEVSGKEVAVFNIGGNFYAIDDTCVHRGGSLSEGSIEEKVVACPWHGWQYDVTTGGCLTNPAAQLTKYEVKVEAGEVFISA